MENVPKIVRERLKAATIAVNHPDSHPDANMLTAFAERSLAEGERNVVLAHLGRCSDCRDIVALALPATEPVEIAKKAPAGAWLTWPALRWGFVAAGVVAVAALGIVQYERGVRSLSLASKAPERFDVAAKEANNQPLALPGPAATSKKADNFRSPSAPADSFDARNATVSEPKRMIHGEAPPAPVPPPGVGLGAAVGGPVRGPLAHGPRMANQWQQQTGVQNQVAAPAASSPFAKQQAAGNPSANVQVPAVSETVTVESQSAQLDTSAQNLEALQVDSRQSKVQPEAGPSNDYALARVDKAKPAETTQTMNRAATAFATATPTVQGADSAALALSAPVPRWTISSTGSLQRSFDQGTTWQAVDVNSSPAYFKDATSTDATSIQITAKASRAKVRKVPSLILRAVTANGADVWAGGSGGALYHSLDAGDHWIRVVPTSSGATLTGDIVGLEFHDMQNGKVSTSTAEVWATSDGGQTWQKQ